MKRMPGILRRMCTSSLLSVLMIFGRWHPLPPGYLLWRVTELLTISERADRYYFPDIDGEDEPLMLEDILPSLTRSPEDEIMRGVIWEAIEACLERLPEAQREVFVMSEFEDMSFKEISELTGEGINTLLSRKRYAVTYLREQLRELYNQTKEK